MSGRRLIDESNPQDHRLIAFGHPRWSLPPSDVSLQRHPTCVSAVLTNASDRQAGMSMLFCYFLMRGVGGKPRFTSHVETPYAALLPHQGGRRRALLGRS